jgi:hypothetical protein
MRYTIEDEEYEFDGEFTLEEAELFYDLAKIGMNELNGELRKGNPYAQRVFMFVIMKRAGKKIRLEDVRKLNVSSWQVIPDEAPESGDDDAAPESTKDPTQSGGATPKPATKNTK